MWALAQVIAEANASKHLLKSPPMYRTGLLTLPGTVKYLIFITSLMYSSESLDPCYELSHSMTAVSGKMVYYGGDIIIIQFCIDR